jgi:hypothetical protein
LIARCGRNLWFEATFTTLVLLDHLLELLDLAPQHTYAANIKPQISLDLFFIKWLFIRLRRVVVVVDHATATVVVVTWAATKPKPTSTTI